MSRLDRIDEIDLEKLQLSELKRLSQRVEDEMERRKTLARDWLAGARKVDLREEAPRFRNPENPAETWSGRGKRPQWLEDLTARGVDPELATGIADSLPADKPKDGGDR